MKKKYCLSLLTFLACIYNCDFASSNISDHLNFPSRGFKPIRFLEMLKLSLFFLKWKSLTRKHKKMSMNNEKKMQTKSHIIHHANNYIKPTCSLLFFFCVAVVGFGLIGFISISVEKQLLYPPVKLWFVEPFVQILV